MLNINVVPLAKYHQRDGFVCGEESLELYIRRFANQDIKRRVSRVFVASPLDMPETVIGYYTLSASHLETQAMPLEQQRKLPRYPIPVAILGRLAVATAYQGQGLGYSLVADALKRVAWASQSLAVYALVVDALNPQVATFYQGFGFIPLPSQPLKLFLPLDSVDGLVG